MIEPPYRRTEGRSRRASAIAVAGIVLSHAHRPTIASNMWPREMSSIASAITSRLTSEVFMPSVPIVMPSEIAMLLNSIGFAPAALMPAFNGPASSRRPKLQGIVSVHTFDTPTNGLSMSSRVSPIACRNARAGARSTPWYSVREMRSGMRGAQRVLVGRDRRVRHAARVLGERLDRAERLREREDLEVLERLQRGGLVAHLEA